MNMNSIGYLIKQGVKNVFKNSIMSLASIGVLFSCLLLIGAASLLSLNLNQVISSIEHQNELVVFLNEDVSEYQIDDISQFLNNLKAIDTVEFIDKDEALKNYIETTGNDSTLYDSLKNDNPLPNTYNVVLSDLSILDKYVSQIEALDGVEKVNAPIEIAKMIVSIKHAINIAGVVIVGILFSVALVIISNTIKLTIYSRRKEINIMKFVGASDFFIKLPFVVEGILIGIISAFLSHIVLWFSYNYLVSKMSEINMQWIINLHNNMISFSSYNLIIWGCFVTIGAFIGILGSSFFVRKYLKV